MSTHIGKKIKTVIAEKKMDVAGFSQKLNLHYTTVFAMLKKPHAGTKKLMEVSKILEHDFFLHYSAELGGTTAAKLKSDAEKLPLLEKENAELKNEIIFLKEVMEALRKK